MKALRLIAATAALSTVLGADRGSNVKIIANPSISATEISREELNQIFLMIKTSFAGSDHIEPVLEKKGLPHAAFLKEYIGKTDSALMTYYRGLMFAGKASIPRAFDSDSKLTDYVAKTKGAIGYVGADSNSAAVRILRVK